MAPFCMAWLRHLIQLEHLQSFGLRSDGVSACAGEKLKYFYPAASADEDEVDASSGLPERQVEEHLGEELSVLVHGKAALPAGLGLNRLGKKWIRASCSLCFARRNSISPTRSLQHFVKMLPATTLKPTFTGPRVPVAQRTRVAVSRATVRVRAGPYDEELIATAVRGPQQI